MTGVQLAGLIAAQNQGQRLICPLRIEGQTVPGRQTVKMDRDQILYEGRRLDRLAKRAMRAHKGLRIGR